VYDDRGEGAPVVLLHGFAASAEGNFHRPRITAAIVAAGRRIISPDARGHGRSEKPHDAAAYADDAMAKDVTALLDHVGVDSCDVVGYSMGSLTTLRVAQREAPARVKSIVLGGVGAGGNSALNRTPEARGAIADAMVADDATAVTNATARGFRVFADSTGADRAALAAVIRGLRTTPDPAELATIAVPTLVIAGDADELAGSPLDLAAQIPGARGVVVTGTHLGAVADPALASTIVEFLQEQLSSRQ
jgi:pimeloyl-ACP methyl ester carboxylesterase